MKNKSLFTIALLIVFTPSVFAAGGEMTPQQIMEKSWSLYTAGVETECKKVALKIYANSEGDGEPIEKELNHWVQYGELEQITVNFLGGRRDRVKARIDREKGQDKRWLKLPSWRKEKPIAVSDSRYFEGTGLTYEDLRELENEALKDFNYACLNPTSPKEGDCWVITGHPKSGVETAYTYRVFWVNDKDFAVEKIEYYNNRGLDKVQENLVICYEQSGRWRVEVCEVVNRQIPRKTAIKVIERYINHQDFNDSVFSRNFFQSDREYSLLD